MKVLHVLEAVGGGTMRHLEDLVRRVPGEHHVACPPQRRSELSHPDPVGALTSAGATVHQVDMSRTPASACNASAVLAVRALARQTDADVVHAHASIAGAVTRAAVRRSRPTLWTPHAVTPGRVAHLVERRLKRWTDTVIALSPSEREQLVAEGLATPEQVVTIPNGVDRPLEQDRADARRRLGLPAGRTLVGFVGRLSEQKAPVDFVRVAALLTDRRPDLDFLCVGTGPLEEQVAAAAADLPAGRFHRSTCDVGAASLLPALDVLVVPSLYEGGPYLPLEAMAAGVPVVATRSTGLRDTVRDGVTGLCADTGDVAGLAAAVERLVDDAQLRTRLSREAALQVDLEFSLDVMAQRYANLYHRATAAQLQPVAPVRTSVGTAW